MSTYPTVSKPDTIQHTLTPSVKKCSRIKVGVVNFKDEQHIKAGTQRKRSHYMLTTFFVLFIELTQVNSVVLMHL